MATRRACATAGLVWLLCAAWTSLGSAELQNVTVGSSVGLPTDPTEVDGFLSPLFVRQMEEFHIPGVAFVLVKDGRVLFSKGYGYADLGQQTPVDPDKTVFRVASVSKVVTATAVMQLVERGELRTDDAVNARLKAFRVEEAFGPPITVANLLTHTAGFDEKAIGRRARRAEDMEPLGRYLAHNMPRQVFAPGTTLSYSNHGMSLAGYLVEEVSGVPFERYVEENVFRPLGMVRSSFGLPEALAMNLATGYEFDDGRLEPRGYEYIKTVPSSMLVTTASDMGRFLVAQLEGGRCGGATVLRPETVGEMQRQQFTQHPRLAGIGYGFLERFYNDLRILWHDGTTYGFSSLLVMVPAQRLGFFVAYNIEDTTVPREQLVRQFFDRYSRASSIQIRRYYYNSAPSPPMPMPGASENRARAVAGVYRHTRHAKTTMEKLDALAGNVPEAVVTANPDGSILLDGYRMVEVEPLLFQYDSGRGYAAFQQDGNGRVTRLFAGMGPAWVFERLPWYERRPFHLALLGTVATVFFLAAPGRALAAGFARLRGKAKTLDPHARRVWRWAYGVSGLNLLFLAGIAATLVLARNEVQYGMPKPVIALLCLPIATTALSAVHAVDTAGLWRKRRGSRALRAQHASIALCAIAFVWFLHYWNLLGFRF